MATIDIAQQRLAAQRVSATTFTRPEQVVAALGAVQAQDYLGALWAIGLRMKAAREADVERAIAERRIIRTWPMRGTLHFVAAPDARWMVELLAPKIAARAVNRLRRYGIDAALLARARRALVRELEGGRCLTRPDAYRVLERARIATGESRGLHLLWSLAHERLICFGARDGKQHTFVLFDEWVPNARAMSRDESLAELARRYFSAHGPATPDDFAWWSGLSRADVRHAIALAGPHEPAAPRATRTRAYALPAFDEMLVGYRDRTALLADTHTRRVNDGGGMLSPTIVLDGRVVATWQRRFARGKVTFELNPFVRLGRADRAAIDLALERYTDFVSAARP